MTPAEQHHRSLPDASFPIVWSGEQHLITAVRCGWTTRVRCWGCDRVTDFSPHGLCATFGRQILATIRDWATGLRCQGCKVKRVQIYHLNDAGSQAEFRSTAWTPFVSQMARLTHLLPLAGVSLDEAIRLATDLPEPSDLRAQGLEAAAEAVERRRRPRGRP